MSVPLCKSRQSKDDEVQTEAVKAYLGPGLWGRFKLGWLFEDTGIHAGTVAPFEQ